MEENTGLYEDKKRVGGFTVSVECVLMCCRDMNYVVMNYLVVKGYKEVAEAFQFESGTQGECFNV